MALSPERRKLRAAKAAMKRHYPDADTSELDARLAAEREADRLAECVRGVVDNAGALTPEDLGKLRSLLPPVSDPKSDGGASDAA